MFTTSFNKKRIPNFHKLINQTGQVLFAYFFLLFVICLRSKLKVISLVTKFEQIWILDFKIHFSFFVKTCVEHLTQWENCKNKHMYLFRNPKFDHSDVSYLHICHYGNGIIQANNWKDKYNENDYI
jgi:hypothetical protein